MSEKKNGFPPRIKGLQFGAEFRPTNQKMIDMGGVETKLALANSPTSVAQQLDETFKQWVNAVEGSPESYKELGRIFSLFTNDLSRIKPYVDDEGESTMRRDELDPFTGERRTSIEHLLLAAKKSQRT